MDDWLFQNMVRANQAVRCPAERLLLSKRRLHFRLSIESQPPGFYVMIVSQQPKPESPVNVTLSIVVPVYKEAGNIQPFLQRTEAVMEKLGVGYEIIFALDPSPDETEAVILHEIERNPAVKLILFSRRFGHPAATMAGILNCPGEKCVVIDVDLQDHPELIEQLYNKM